MTVPFAEIFLRGILIIKAMTSAILYRSVLHQVDDEVVWRKGPQDVHKLVVGAEVRNKKHPASMFFPSLDFLLGTNCGCMPCCVMWIIIAVVFLVQGSTVKLSFKMEVCETESQKDTKARFVATTSIFFHTQTMCTFRSSKRKTCLHSPTTASRSKSSAGVTWTFILAGLGWLDACQAHKTASGIG